MVDGGLWPATRPSHVGCERAEVVVGRMKEVVVVGRVKVVMGAGLVREGGGSGGPDEVVGCARGRRWWWAR
jgi:hypothetical protein